MDSVDKTIEKICDWIEKSIDTVETTEESVVISEMIKALAELMSANAGRTYNIDSKKLSEQKEFSNTDKHSYIPYTGGGEMVIKEIREGPCEIRIHDDYCRDQTPEQRQAIIDNASRIIMEYYRRKTA